MSKFSVTKFVSEERHRFILRVILFVLIGLFVALSIAGTTVFHLPEGTFSFLSINVMYGLNSGSPNIPGRISFTISILVLFLLAFSNTSKTYSFTFILFAIATVLFAIRLDYFSLINFEDAYYDELIVSPLNIIAIINIITGSLASLLALFISLDKSRFRVIDIAEIAIFVALAVILDLPFAKITMNADGGSVSLEWIPLIIIVLRHGPLKGFMASGLIYGLISCLIGGHGVASFPFDYLLAFGSFGLIGFFSNLILTRKRRPINYVVSGILLILSVTLATGAKILSHTIGGIVLYNASLIGSLVYNAPPNLITLPITVGVLLVLLTPLLLINRRFPVSSK